MESSNDEYDLEGKRIPRVVMEEYLFDFEDAYIELNDQAIVKMWPSTFDIENAPEIGRKLMILHSDWVRAGRQRRDD